MFWYSQSNNFLLQPGQIETGLPLYPITTSLHQVTSHGNGVRNAGTHRMTGKVLTWKPRTLRDDGYRLVHPTPCQVPQRTPIRALGNKQNPHPNPKSNALFFDYHRLLRFVTSLSPRPPARQPSPRPRDGGLRRPPRRARQVGRRRRRRGQVSERSLPAGFAPSLLVHVRCLMKWWRGVCSVLFRAAGSRRRTGWGRAVWTWRCSRRPTARVGRYGPIRRPGSSGTKGLTPWWAHFGLCLQFVGLGCGSLHWYSGTSPTWLLLCH